MRRCLCGSLLAVTLLLVVVVVCALLVAAVRLLVSAAVIVLPVAVAVGLLAAGLLKLRDAESEADTQIGDDHFEVATLFAGGLVCPIVGFHVTGGYHAHALIAGAHDVLGEVFECCASHEYGISVHCLPVTITSTRIVRDGESDRISPLLGVCGDIAYECECRLSCHGFLVSLFLLCEHIQYNKHI